MYGRLVALVLLGGCAGLPSQNPRPPPTDPRPAQTTLCPESGPMSGNAAASVEDEKLVQEFLYRDAPED
jgi:hypothetical protein